MQDDDFRECLVRARGGDRAALGKILETIEDRLRHAARKRLGQRLRGKIQTSDVLQTTYLDVVRSIGDFAGDDPETFAAWVDRMLENNVRDKAKFFDRARRRQDHIGQDTTSVELNGATASGPTPSQRVMHLEQLHLVGRALERLDEPQRQVIVLRMIQGRDYPDIARELDRSEGAVRMLFSRARAALALELDRMLDGR